MPKNHPFSKEIRLRKKKEIDLVFKKGIFLRLGWIRVKYLPTELRSSRYLISVSKKVGHSPYRNHLKRLVRETIRLHRSEHGGSYDICIFFTQRPQIPMTFQYIESQIVHIFSELNRVSKKIH